MEQTPPLMRNESAGLERSKSNKRSGKKEDVVESGSTKLYLLPQFCKIVPKYLISHFSNIAEPSQDALAFWDWQS